MHFQRRSKKRLASHGLRKVRRAHHQTRIGAHGAPYKGFFGAIHGYGPITSRGSAFRPRHPMDRPVLTPAWDILSPLKNRPRRSGVCRGEGVLSAEAATRKSESRESESQQRQRGRLGNVHDAARVAAVAFAAVVVVGDCV